MFFERIGAMILGIEWWHIWNDRDEEWEKDWIGNRRTKLYTQIPNSAGRLRIWNITGWIGVEGLLLFFFARWTIQRMIMERKAKNKKKDFSDGIYSWWASFPDFFFSKASWLLITWPTTKSSKHLKQLCFLCISKNE